MTRADKEAQLVAQYFNGTYNDAQFTCQCSGNNPPVAPTTPVRTNTDTVTQPNQRDTTTNGTNPRTEPVAPTPFPLIPESGPTDVVLPTMEDQLNEVLNNNNIFPPLGPTADNSVPNNMFIEEPQLPSSSDLLAQQSGASDGSPNLKAIPESDMKNAGGWLLALIAAGLVIRQLTKGKDKK